MQLINSSRSITISSNDKETVIEELKSREISARDTYEIARNEYIRDNESATNAILIFSAVIIVISLIEVFLMKRSSFLISAFTPRLVSIFIMLSALLDSL